MKRVITGFIFGFIWLAILLTQSFHVLWGVVLIIGCLGLYEYFAICIDDESDKFLRNSFLVFAALPFVAAYFGRIDVVLLSLFLAILLCVLIILNKYAQISNPFSMIAKFCFGIIWISLNATHINLIMANDNGVYWLAFLSVITVASDTGAYYTGSQFGKNKLCPAISPGKTVEGFIGGLFFGVVFAVGYCYFFIPQIQIWKIISISLILSCLGVAGDLTESIIKRSNHIKDSGNLLPGHGGILDRIDSILVAAPALFYALHFNFI